ncbi:MFS transporter [Testudinibacter aquarius]|uniref:MFS transporter n=1 Tax=Testudinibacter aquarius TaxID=1524974 RepID=A0A4R3YCS0_9PAST|nr:MFS transporter [Testudinibacter aquarius]KAE9529367.1 MFS transporter [Testudinibacter aquarius]TCV89887.1 ACS family D-galactonate transporter-like MFS transporter [Testudinibacter aquarius]TNG93739.1 MFS transporter [Testudinibacter aquarius]
MVQNKASNIRWFVFCIIFLLVVVNLIDRISLSIAMPTIAKEFDLSPTMQGVILSSFFWAYALLQIPGGWLIDKYGPRKMITGSTVLWGIFQTLAAFSTGGISLLLSRFMLGAGEAPLFPAGGKLNATWLSSKERGRGAVIMDCGGPLGAALGGIIIAYMIAVIGSWRTVFGIIGVITMLLGIVTWKYLRDTPQEHTKVNEQELKLITSGQENATQSAVDSEQISTGIGIPMLSLASILFGRAAWAMMFFGLLTWGPSYLAQARGFDIKGVGNATFIIFLCGSLGSLCGGFFSDSLVKRGIAQRIAIKGVLSISGISTLIAFSLLPNMSNPITAITTLSVAAFFLMWGSLYWSFPALLAPKNKAGLVGGIMNMAGSIGGIVVPILVGFILQKSNDYNNVLFFFAGCSVVYILGTLSIQLSKQNR